MEQDTSRCKTPNSQPKKTENLTGSDAMLAAIKSRIFADVMALPFLTVWSLIICLLLDNIVDEKVNTFLADTFSEGIGTRTILSLLLLACIVSGLSWIVRPKSGSLVCKIFLAPVNAARSTCITTFAFFLGLIIATAITRLSKAQEMLPTLGIFFLLWVLLNCTEALASEASCNREAKYSKFCIVFGILLVACTLWMMYTFYNQIRAGSFT